MEIYNYRRIIFIVPKLIISNIVTLTLRNVPAGLSLNIFPSLLSYTSLRATLVYNDTIYSLVLMTL